MRLGRSASRRAAARHAPGRRGRDVAVADSVVVAHADRLGARSAALDEGDAPLGRRGFDAEYLRDLLRARLASRGAGPVRRGAGDESARVAVAPREAASAAVRARKRRGDHADAGILLDAEVAVRYRERERRDKSDSRDDCNCYRHLLNL